MRNPYKVVRCNVNWSAPADSEGFHKMGSCQIAGGGGLWNATIFKAPRPITNGGTPRPYQVASRQTSTADASYAAGGII